MRLSNLTSADAVQAALDEYSLKGQATFLADHGFGKSRDYLVRNPLTGEWADSKAIAGVALAYQFVGSGGLSARQFSGGEATVAPRLVALGFEVKRIDEIGGTDWHREEVELIVADYLAMLTSELTGQAYSQTTRHRHLLSLLPGRSLEAIKFKHANISAVMLELGFPYLREYMPKANFQSGLLVDAVVAQISKHSLLDEVVLAAVQMPATDAEEQDFSQVRASVPDRQIAANESTASYGRTPIKRDYLEREARNRSLGLAGEEFAMRFERWRLNQLGARHLADRVVHVSKVEGDGRGYDIRSFEQNGSERYVEVKTTSFGERTPFFVSVNEVRFARDHAQQFHIYRVFDFRMAPRIFQLDGPIDRHCNLDATTFMASFG